MSAFNQAYAYVLNAALKFVKWTIDGLLATEYRLERAWNAALERNQND